MQYVTGDLHAAAVGHLLGSDGTYAQTGNIASGLNGCNCSTDCLLAPAVRGWRHSPTVFWSGYGPDAVGRTRCRNAGG